MCECACTHTLCFWSCSLVYTNIPLSIYFHNIFSWGGGGIGQAFSQALALLVFSLSIIIHLVSVCHFFLSMSTSLSLFCFMLLCALLLPLRGGWVKASTYPAPYSPTPPTFSLLQHQCHYNSPSLPLTYLHYSWLC